LSGWRCSKSKIEPGITKVVADMPNERGYIQIPSAGHRKERKENNVVLEIGERERKGC
jgi:hypothetical protein